MDSEPGIQNLIPGGLNRSFLSRECLNEPMIPERVAAVKVLMDKWFAIGMATRLKARPFLEEYLMSLEDKF